MTRNGSKRKPTYTKSIKMAAIVALLAIFQAHVFASGALAHNNSSDDDDAPVFDPYASYGATQVSLNIVTARSTDRVMSQINREIRSATKNYCSRFGTNGRQNVFINGRLRRLRFLARVDNLDIAIGRNGDNSYSGTANLSFSCVLN